MGVSYNGSISTSTSSERAIEIFNLTLNPVNLNLYSVRRYSNGSVTPTEEERLFRSNATQQAVGVNVLNSRTTFVLASGEVTLLVIRNAANQFSVGHAPVSGPTVLVGGGTVYFNVDDAVALVRYPSGTAGPGTGVIVDLVGVIGEQPRPQNCSPSALVTGAAPTPPMAPVPTRCSLLRPISRSCVGMLFRGMLWSTPRLKTCRWCVRPCAKPVATTFPMSG